jgi:hypothetical protein
MNSRRDLQQRYIVLSLHMSDAHDCAEPYLFGSIGWRNDEETTLWGG